jgi:hypothetical protein
MRKAGGRKDGDEAIEHEHVYEDVDVLEDMLGSPTLQRRDASPDQCQASPPRGLVRQARRHQFQQLRRQIHDITGLAALALQLRIDAFRHRAQRPTG